VSDVAHGPLVDGGAWVKEKPNFVLFLKFSDFII
jgi:hypothetical protein